MTRLGTPRELRSSSGPGATACPAADPSGLGPDGTAVELVYCRYVTRIFAIAVRMLGAGVDAEDVTQEVLLQVVRRLDTFRGDSTLHTWLYRVTVNAVLALRRKRPGGREMPFADDDLPAARSRQLPAPESAVLRGELRDRLDDAIGRLPEAYRDVFVLADVENLSNADIGQMLGLSLSAVKSRLHRARLMLRDALQPYLAECHATHAPARAAVRG